MGWSRKRKVGIILVSIFIVVFVVPVVATIAYEYNLRVNHPEEYAKLEAEWVRDRLAKEGKQRLEEQQRQEELRQKQELTREEAKITQLSQLPKSCEGVHTTETSLYPTADRCVQEIMTRVYNWCLAEERKLSDKGAEARADICVVDFKRRLAQQCEDPVLGASREQCIMYTLQELYPKMIPE